MGTRSATEKKEAKTGARKPKGREGGQERRASERAKSGAVNERTNERLPLNRRLPGVSCQQSVFGRAVVRRKTTKKINTQGGGRGAGRCVCVKTDARNKRHLRMYVCTSCIH